MRFIYIIAFLLSLLAQDALSMTIDCGTESAVSKSTYRPLNLVEPNLIIALTDEGRFKVWDDNQRFDLSYCISNKFKGLKERVVEATVFASKEWMKYANIRFIYKPEEDDHCTSKNKNVLFRIQIKNSRRTRYRGRAFFPGEEQKNRRIFLKKKHIEDNPNDIERLMLHELGHVLGFRHEHIHEESVRECKEKSPYFESVTDYDRLSIMHYTQCGGLNKSGRLSDFDKQGAEKAYP